MALIKCDECGKEVSDRAMSCPNCGNPFFDDGEDTVTIQQTDKVWKLIKLLSWIVIILGIMVLPTNEIGQGAGISAIGLGIIGLIIAKFGAWWSNG